MRRRERRGSAERHVERGALETLVGHRRGRQIAGMLRTSRVEKDLFGHPIRRRKPRLQSVLERLDRATLQPRLERAQRVQRMFPKGYSFLMSIETAYVFEEAKMAFINGQFVSTILLAVAFTEHWLGSFLGSRGFEKEARSGLKGIVACLRRHGLVQEFILGKVDRLREIRNPFVHFKPTEHPHRITRRVWAQRRDPNEILRRDAEEGLSLMYQVSIYPLR